MCCWLIIIYYDGGGINYIIIFFTPYFLYLRDEEAVNLIPETPFRTDTIHAITNFNPLPP